jgi:hypothetical protein
MNWGQSKSDAGANQINVTAMKGKLLNIWAIIVVVISRVGGLIWVVHKRTRSSIHFRGNSDWILSTEDVEWGVGSSLGVPLFELRVIFISFTSLAGHKLRSVRCDINKNVCSKFKKRKRWHAFWVFSVTINRKFVVPCSKLYGLLFHV